MLAKTTNRKLYGVKLVVILVLCFNPPMKHAAADELVPPNIVDKEAKTLSVEGITKALDDRVFIRSGDKDSWYIVKWSKPINVNIGSEPGVFVDPDALEMIASAFKQVKSATNLDIRFFEKKNNFMIIIARDPALFISSNKDYFLPFFSTSEIEDHYISVLRQGVTCVPVPIFTERRELRNYLAIASVGSANGKASLLSCLNYEILFGTGFFGLADWDKAASDNTDGIKDLPQSQFIQVQDLVLLKILYSDDFHTGDTRASVLEAVKRAAEKASAK